MEGDYKKYIKMYIILYNIKVGPKQSPLGTRLTKARLYRTCYKNCRARPCCLRVNVSIEMFMQGKWMNNLKLKQ